MRSKIILNLTFLVLIRPTGPSPQTHLPSTPTSTPYPSPLPDPTPIVMTFCPFNDCYTLNNSILVSILNHLKHLRTLTFQSRQKKIFTMQKYKNRFVVQNNVRGVFCRTFLSSFAKLYISTFLLSFCRFIFH